MGIPMRFSGLSELGMPNNDENIDEDIQVVNYDQRESCRNHRQSSFSSLSYISRGTQTSLQHIRQSNLFPTLKPRCRRSTRCKDESSGEGTSKDLFSGRQNKKKIEQCNKCDKSTSTSDLFSDCPEQVLRIVSETLVSLTVVSSDLSDIIIDYSRKLLHIKALACRILKNVQLHYCPNLMRMQVIRCPMMNASDLARNMMSISAEKGRVVYYEPLDKEYDQNIIEKTVFGDPTHDYDVLLLHAFSPGTNSVMYCEKLSCWVRLLTKINSLLLKCSHVQSAKRCYRYVNSYPWGNELSFMQGTLPNGHYTLSTNNPWFKELCKYGDFTEEIHCLPSPEVISHDLLNNMHSILGDIIAELNEMKIGICRNVIGFYVHMPEGS